MKYIIAFVLLFSNIQESEAQGILITKSRSAEDNKEDYLHSIANEFSDEVGSKLKELYPARVEKVTIVLECEDEKLVLTYSAKIVSCEEDVAHYYFDRRGSFSTSTSLQNAQYDAKRRCNNQVIEVISEFKEKYKRSVTVLHGYSSHTQCNNLFSAVNESFIVVGR